MSLTNDYEKLFRVRLSELVNDLQNNHDVEFSNFGQLLYRKRELYYQEFGEDKYRPISLSSIASNSKVQSLAVEVLNNDIHKGEIISIKRLNYSPELDYTAVMSRTIQGLDDIGILFENINSKN